MYYPLLNLIFAISRILVGFYLISESHTLLWDVLVGGIYESGIESEDTDVQFASEDPLQSFQRSATGNCLSVACFIRRRSVA